MAKTQILVVEDEALVAERIRDGLSSMGYRVPAMVTSGEDAVKMAGELGPDLVLMDIKLAGKMDGVAAAEELWSRLDIPVVYLTAHADDETLQRAKMAEPFGYIVKPFRDRDLQSTVEMALYKHEIDKRLRGSEKMLRQHSNELALLNEAGRVFSSTLDLDQVFAAILEEARRLLDVTACSVWLIDSRTGELVCQQATGPHCEVVRGWRLAPQEGLVGWVVRCGESLIVPNAQVDPRHFRGVDQRTGLILHSVLGVPLRVKGNVIGALQAVDTRIGRFRAADLRLMEPLAASAAIAIGNARLFEQAQQEIAERVRTEAELRESEERYRTLFDGVPVGINRTIPTGRIIDANLALVQMLGFPDRGTLLATNAADTYVDPEDRERWRALIERAGTVRNFKMHLRRCDGTTIWAQSNARVVRDADGRVVYYEGSLEDITERVRAEEALRRSLEETARSQRLLLALSQAAQAVQRARTPQQVYQTVGDEITELGYEAAILTLTEDQAHLVVSHLTLDSAVLRAAEKLTGLSAQAYRIPLVPGGVFQQLIAEDKTVFSEQILGPTAEALPRLVRPLVSQLRAVLGFERAIAAPLTIGGEPHGLLAVLGSDLTKADVPAVTAFANQAAIAVENAQLQAQQKQRLTQMMALGQTALDITSQLDMPPLLHSVILRAARLLGATGGEIHLYDPEEKRLEIVASQGLAADFTGTKLVPGEGMAGRVVQDGEPRIVNDYRNWSGRSPQIADALDRAIIGVPMKWRDQVIGALDIIDQTGDKTFDEDDVWLLSHFADQAAIAIQNARLFEQVRLGRERLQALSRQLLEIQETERRHIARELHDEIGQILTGLNLLLEISVRAPAEEGGASLREARMLVRELMDKVDQLSLDLRPAMLDDLGLLPALLWHLERYTTQTGVQVDLEHAGLERRFASEVETAAYRIVQEALTNVARHAGVREVAVRLWADQDVLGVQVEDQGAGFDPQVALGAAASGGLSGMHERAALLGGQFTVESAPRAGARLTAEWPLNGPRQKEAS